jgi:hypothetical protein
MNGEGEQIQRFTGDLLQPVSGDEPVYDFDLQPFPEAMMTSEDLVLALKAMNAQLRALGAAIDQLREDIRNG